MVELCEAKIECSGDRCVYINYFVCTIACQKPVYIAALVAEPFKCVNNCSYSESL